MGLDTSTIKREFLVRQASQRRAIAPAYSVVTYFRAIGLAEQVRELIDSTLSLLSSQLRYYCIGEGARLRAWHTDRFCSQLTTWCQRPTTKRYFFFAGDGDIEAPEASISGALHFLPMPTLSASQIRSQLKSLEVMAAKLVRDGKADAQGVARAYASINEARKRLEGGERPPSRATDSWIHVRIPLECWAEPQGLLEWLRARPLLRGEGVVSAHAGVGLDTPFETEPEDDESAVDKRLAGMLLRSPTVDWESSDPPERQRLLDDDGSEHFVKRARWLNVISPQIVDRLGGAAHVAEACARGPRCRMEWLGVNCLLIAGDSPDPTGPGANGLLEASRYLNRLFKPVQLDRYGSPIGAPKDFTEQFLSLGATGSDRDPGT